MLEVERQVAGVAVVEPALVDVDHAPDIVVRIEHVDASAVPLGDVHVAVPGKRKAGGDAVPIGGAGLPAGVERIRAR